MLEVDETLQAADGDPGALVSDAPEVSFVEEDAAVGGSALLELGRAARQDSLVQFPKSLAARKHRALREPIESRGEEWTRDGDARLRLRRSFLFIAPSF
jgi:hypothetical protein